MLFGRHSISSFVAHTFRRSRTSTRKKRPKLVELSPPTPLSDAVFKAWEGFDGRGKGLPLKDYYNDELQEIFKKLIGRNPKFLKHINKARNPVIADYKLVHSDKFGELNKEVEALLDRFFTTVPVLSRRKANVNSLVQSSPELNGYDKVRYVFTDISRSKNNNNRTILVRYPNGDLKWAPWEVRDRINIVYFGLDSEMYPFPKFITHENVLKDALTLDKHLYILSYALSTCQADSSYYIQVFQTVFDDIIAHKKYPCIEFTPFYGPFLYHAVVSDKFPQVVKYYYDLINSAPPTDDLEFPEILKTLNIGRLMKIYSILKPDSKTAHAIYSDQSQAIDVFLNEMEVINNQN